ncbi:MAG: hypothetical protein RR561_00680 [Peptostreptococcus sp.]|uniref:hypothetical protein n=1 Tax=Peptostreptococcus sp. TaxID=1262 RepID=UPI002FCB1A8E
MLELLNLKMESDFDYRIIKSDDYNMDIYIELDYRAVDIVDKNMEFCNSRIQFPRVKAMIIRITTLNNLMTIHLLRDIDLLSAFANFEVDYSGSVFKILKKDEYVILEKEKI